jgi:hypothetical protein
MSAQEAREMLVVKGDPLKEVIVLRAKIWPRMAMFITPMLLICVVGYIINGGNFFSLQHLSQIDSVIINEYVGFSALAVFFIICIWNIIVLIISNGVLISINKDMLVLNGIKRIPLNMINIDAIKISDFGRNRISIGMVDGSSVGLSVAFADANDDIIALLRQKICDLKIDV